MIGLQRAARVATFAAVLALAPSVARSQQAADILSLRVSSEIAPPGAIAQLKIDVTEATPITTGDSHIFWSLAAIDGIALGADDVAGVAVVRDGDIQLSIVSPTASFGMSSDYPAVTLTGRVPADATLGMRLPVTLDRAALRIFDANGALYTAAEIDDGKVTVDDKLTISDVVPGGADLPAGSVVSMFGTGFTRNTRVAFGDALLAQVRYVSPTQIDVVLAEPARMRGMRIRARDESGFRVVYFSYQRTSRASASADPLLRDAVPLFPVRGMQAASVRVGGTTVGLALQNVEATEAQVVAELTNDEGVPVAAAIIRVGVNQFIVRTLSEIFEVPVAGPGLVRLTSTGPLQVLGVDVDAGGAARPRLPQ
jgi:hypothetical protein